MNKELVIRQLGKTGAFRDINNIELIKVVLKELNYSLPKYLKLSRRRRKIFIQRKQSRQLARLSIYLNLV